MEHSGETTMLRMAFVLGIALVPSFATAQEPDLTGRWSGYWQSDKNGHTGPLNARFTAKPDGSYRVVFTGRFAKIIPFIYATTFQASSAGPDMLNMSASQNLGPGLGTFDTNGYATSSNFDARFSARGDSGRFVMSRRR
jgi:hypothetical protein